jgi:outer membrane biosynthesis protein TonB
MSRIVEVHKPTPDTKLGVRLSGSKGKPVKVVEINEQGPLAGKVGKGDIIASINGVRCSEGHSKAAEALRNASGVLKLEIGVKRSSSFFSKKPSAQVLSKAQSSFTNVDETPTPPPPKPTPMPVQTEEPVVAAPAVPAPPPPKAVVPEPPKAVAPEPPPQPPQPALAPEPIAAAEAAMPTGADKAAAAPPPLAPDEYMVTLQRNKCARRTRALRSLSLSLARSDDATESRDRLRTPHAVARRRECAAARRCDVAVPTNQRPQSRGSLTSLACGTRAGGRTASIGMRLVQKKHTELPFIADIDPQGPAAKTEITPGDMLLQVNGIDARASESHGGELGAACHASRAPHTHAHTRSHTHAQTHAHARTHTHTHVRTPPTIAHSDC